VIRRLSHFDDTADLDDGLALGDQLLGGLELADDLLRCVSGAFHGEVPGPVWPDEDSHSPWTDFRGPRHEVFADEQPTTALDFLSRSVAWFKDQGVQFVR